MKKFSLKLEHEKVSREEYNNLLAEFNAVHDKLSFYEALVESSPLPFFAKNSEARFSVVNKAFRDFFDIKEEEILGKSLKDMQYLPEDEREKLHSCDLEIIQNIGETHFETTYKLARGNFPVLFWSKGFRHPVSDLSGLVGIIVDISAQRKLEQMLENTVHELETAKNEAYATSERMQHLLDHMPLSAQIWAEDGQLLESSMEMVRIFGLKSKEEYIERFQSLNPVYQPDGQKSVDKGPKLLAQALEIGHAHTEWIHLSPSGEHIPFDVTLVRSFLQGKTVILAFLKDLREHYATEKKLQEADSYSRVMLDLSPYGTLIWDQDFNLVHCNKALAVTFGLQEPEDFIENFLDLIPEYQPDGMLSMEKMQGELHKAFTEGASECFWMGKNIFGDELPSEVTTVRTFYRGEYMIVAYVKDLREVEDNKRKAIIAEQRIQGILNGVPLGINILSQDFKLLDCNELAAKMGKFENKEDYINNFENIFPYEQPDGRLTQNVVEENIGKAAQEGKVHLEITTLDKFGNSIPYEVNMVMTHLENESVFIAYAHDLTETKRMLNEIERAKESAEKSAQAKSEFLANMSHEIRTPMNGILGLLHILKDTELNSLQSDYVQKTLFSTNELLRIINDILDFSKIEAGKLEMESVPFNLHNLCTELEGLVAPSLYKKELDFVLDEGAYAKLAVLGDPLRLKQVLLNLLGNAIKFTQKGSIGLSINSDIISNKELQCKFAVTDTGIGLSKEQLKKLFSAFSQADSSVTRKYGGTGLGLAISKRIVEIMGGRIWVESIVNQGSSFIFTVTFPLAQESIVEEKNDILEMPIMTEHKDAHLLLVEDNLINQLIAEELLKKGNYTLDIANNGQEAIEMLNEKHYDAVLMDIQMPVMDGLTATKQIRQNPKFAHIPIIAMSAHAMSGDKEKSLSHGMNDHITKPISPSILYSTLKYWLQSKESL